MIHVPVMLTRAQHDCTKLLHTPLHTSSVGFVSANVARTAVASSFRAASYLVASGGVKPKAPT
eukprot:2136362-Prymnesium_polylepis.1